VRISKNQIFSEVCEIDGAAEKPYSCHTFFAPMRTTLLVIQLVVSVLLAFIILLQNRGEGLSGVFGGSGGEFFATRRGAERLFFRATIVLAILFAANALVFAFLPQLEVFFA